MTIALDPSVDHKIQLITTGRLAESTCNTDLAAGSVEFDTRPGYGPGSSMGDVIPVGSPRQGELPAEYREASDEELDARIRAAKATLGDRVVILGHFYQREEVVRHADYVGDSFQLANAAKDSPNAEAIVFCGVHFMAETADLLSRHDQKVILPNLAAGCSMADMANIDQVEECWEQLEELFGPMDEPDADGLVPVIPVTYMNSAADLKGFVGRHGGIVLHVVEREDGARVGVRAGTPGAVLPRPAPRAQHREGDGRAARADAAVEPEQAVRRQRRGCGRGLCGSSCGTGSARCTAGSRSSRSTRPAPTSPACA